MTSSGVILLFMALAGRFAVGRPIRVVSAQTTRCKPLVMNPNFPDGL